MGIMARLFRYLPLMLLLLLACDDFDHTIAFQELDQWAYSRQIGDPNRLIDYLNHPDPNIRLKAVQTLAILQDPARAVQIANRLKDEDPRVRSAAAFALGQLFANDRRVEDYIIDAWSTEKDSTIRRRLIEALGKSGAMQRIFPLQDFIESDNLKDQQAAAIAAGILGYRGLSPEPLITFLGRRLITLEDPETLWRYAYALYQINKVSREKSFYSFKAALEKEAPLVKFFVLKGLGVLFEQFESPQFQEFVRRSRNNAGVQQLVKDYRSRSFRLAVADQLKNPTWYVRVAALNALGKLKDPALQEIIAQSLNDPHPVVQVQAIRTLAEYRNWAARKYLRQVYRTAEDWRLRGEALVGLARIQPKQALALVEQDLLPQPWPKNYYAVRVLEQIDSPREDRGTDRAEETTIEEATQRLTQLAQSEPLALRTLALEVLVSREKPPTLNFFLEQLKSGDPAIVRLIALYISRRFRTPGPAYAVGPLTEAYKQLKPPRDLKSMEMVIEALERIGSEEAVPFLEEQLSSPYAAIREAARRAIVRIAGHYDKPLPPVTDLPPTRRDFPPLNPDSLYEVTFTTVRGKFTVRLFPEKAPVNAAHIALLARTHFYDSLYVHQVIPGHLVQFGDPRGDGWGGAGYNLPCEYNDVPFDRGVVGIAHAGKDTGSSQLFILQTPHPHLNGLHTAVGRVVSGMEVVDSLMLYDPIISSRLEVKPAGKVLAE
ncbi:MAG: hypothetical protein D6681_01995, partial [Calditrichaeota bacterium]